MTMQQRVLADADVRYLAVSMINMETDRDRQEQIGASTLSNPCDNCLAAEFRGDKRVSEFADRPFLGGALGTLFHNGLELRQNIANGIYPGALMEQKVSCCTIPGYGEIPGHFDLQPTAWHILDWKGSLRWKIAILEDLLQAKGLHRVGLAPRWKKQKDTKAYEGGYKFEADSHTTVSLSAKEYREEMAEMEHKYLGYYGQQNLYMHSKQAKRASLVFIARDGTGFFDNPEFSGYDDLERKHDIFVWSFTYDPSYTQALIQRGTDIVAAIHAGAKPGDFQSHEHCFYCNTQAEHFVDVPRIEYAALDTPANAPAQIAA
ncbi:MAG: 62, gp43 [Microbacterium sp.]|nr:62, gp43 [Microbacterium sp.]